MAGIFLRSHFLSVSQEQLARVGPPTEESEAFRQQQIRLDDLPGVVAEEADPRRRRRRDPLPEVGLPALDGRALLWRQLVHVRQLLGERRVAAARQPSPAPVPTPRPIPRARPVKLAVSSYSYWHFRGERTPIEQRAAMDGRRVFDVAEAWGAGAVELLEALPSESVADVVSTRMSVGGVPLPELLHAGVARERLADVLF